MLKKTLQVKTLLSYSVVFPERHDKIEDLLSDVPSATAVEVISHMLSKKMNGENELEIWIPWHMNTRNDVWNKINQYVQQNINLTFIEPYSMLLLISRILTCYNGRNDKLTKDDCSNLLMAYMLCCDERIELNKDLPYDTMTADEFVKNYMPDCLKSYDIEWPRDFRLLLIKCYMLLLEFPKHNAKFANYVDEFCKDRKLQNAKYYFDQLFKTYLELLSEDKSNCRMRIEEGDQDAREFFDNMSMDTSHYKHDNDFLMMRERPILKTGSNVYNFMFMNMFLDKAYTGLLFDMKDVLVKREILDAKEGYINLRAFLGEEFSERFFYYTLMEKCYGNHYLRYSGEELENTLGEGMPDYYMRRGNCLFVFECKDAQIASTKKLSGDYEIVKNAIFDKFVVNAKGHSKGIMQLAKVVEEKLPIILTKMDTATSSETKFVVFPIIVYFDDCFDVEGPSYLLNKEFRKLINNASCSANFVIRDIVMINIEMLMMLENLFADDKLELATLINSYIDFKSLNEIYHVFPFNKYMFLEAQNKGFELSKTTRWFDEINQNLVDMDKKGKENEMDTVAPKVDNITKS